jgi:hypothetical protein
MQMSSVPILIELDAYSGRPNPRWELTLQQSTDLVTLLRTLSAEPGAQKESEGLGYRGFLVELPNGAFGAFKQLRVYRGKVFATGANRSEVFNDPKRLIESRLLATGRSHVEEGAMEYVRKEIALP